jgi:hypothetical protein
LSRNIKVNIYKTIILPAVVRVWNLSPLSREQHRLRVFENIVLRKIFGPKRDEAVEEW